MPSSKKKSGSAAANNQRPQPVHQTSVPSRPTSAMLPPAIASPSTVQQTRTSDTTDDAAEPEMTAADQNGPTANVNRKKQKRRQKAAARLAEQQHLNSGYPLTNGQVHNGHVPYLGRGPQKGYFTEEPDYPEDDYEDEDEVEDAFYSGEEQDDVYDMPSQPHGGSKKKKKKKNRKASHLLDEVRATSIAAASLLERSAMATQQALANANLDTRTPAQKRRDQIWHDSKNAERENIKQFWLDLDEDGRKSLVQIEKEAVLRKMKEQKAQCNCAVCGRKRTAIEDELEVLYDAYYKELENYAGHTGDASQPNSLMPPPRSREPARRHSHSYPPPPAPPGHFDNLDDEEDDEEDYEDEYDEDDELYSDDELEEVPRMPEEFYHFSQNLRVKDGILTVADDLLKNDGKEFINMMDKLADRRMAREEEARFPQTSLAHQDDHGHNHPLDEEEYDDEDDEEDEDYDSQDLDEEEEEEMDALTERQRMEEGRRMFQVFAARMFEQRVMTAYRENIARERQRKLIEELDEESRLDTQREAKKAREAAKKKEKKKQQKQAKEEEKAKKDAEKAAQEAEIRAAEEKKQEEQRQRREEQRKKREAEKKAQEEERTRKEAEKQKKAQQERERQAEADRKQREAKEREKKKREEARKKEREEREAKEKEVREQRSKEERERKAKDVEVRRQKDTAAKLDREVKGKDEQHQQRRPPVAVPPGLLPQSAPSKQSPHFAVATPMIPKAPTPARPRQASQQGPQSHGSSPRSQQAATDTSRTSASPASAGASQTPVSSIASAKAQGQQPILHHPQPSAPLSPLNQPGRQNFAFGGYGMPGMPGHGPPPGMMPQMPQMPMYQGPPMGGQYRNFSGYPNNMPFPPGMNGNRPYPQRQGGAMPFPGQPPMQPPTSMPQPIVGKESARAPTHSRQPSGSFERQADQPQPIGRPAPIGRPSSTTPDKQNKRRSVEPDVDDLTTQLGSKALLDDSDLPLDSGSPNDQPQPANLGLGGGRMPSFTGFNDPIQKHDAFQLGPSTPQTNTWAFGTSPGGTTWGPSPSGINLNQSLNSGWPGSAPNGPATNAFGMGSSMLRSHHASRPVSVRMMTAQACKRLTATTENDGYHYVEHILEEISQTKPPHEPPVGLKEVLDILDTEGNHQNGGGSFAFRGDGPNTEVRFDLDDGTLAGSRAIPGRGPSIGGSGRVGDIGSPIVGHSQMPHHHHQGHSSHAPGVFGGIGSRF